MRDYHASRDWYVDNPARSSSRSLIGGRRSKTTEVSPSSSGGRRRDTACPNHSVCLTFQVANVDAAYRELAARGIGFTHVPQKLFWGYGAELLDPDGYRIRLWDETSMQEKGSS